MWAMADSVRFAEVWLVLGLVWTIKTILQLLPVMETESWWRLGVCAPM